MYEFYDYNIYTYLIIISSINARDELSIIIKNTINVNEVSIKCLYTYIYVSYEHPSYMDIFLAVFKFLSIILSLFYGSAICERGIPKIYTE